MRVALGIEYNGTNYHGWQRQPNLPTVQQHVETALTQVANQPIEVQCAGRTDIGVHAKEQVVHFDTTSRRKLDAWVLGGNSNLSNDIAILWAKKVSSDFHARFSAKARRYRYLIYNAKIRPAMLNNQVTWHYASLNEKLMHEAGQYLLGEHDFSSFRGCDCQSKSPMRNVMAIQVKRQHKLVIIDIKANAFLMHMVRNIAGVLMAIGQGKKDPIWAKEVLQACDRTVAGVTAPACGLYFMRVDY